MNDDTISRLDAIDALAYFEEKSPTGRTAQDVVKALPSAQADMAEKLYLYKCFITDQDGLQHEVIHTGDIRRVTGWEI